MHDRNKRRWLLVLSLAQVTGAIVALVWAITGPVGAPDRSPGRTTVPEQTEGPEQPPAITPEAFVEISERRLQRPLYDPPPPPPAPVVKKKPPSPPPLTLIATMVESGGSQAMFTVQSGGMVLKGIGGVIASPSGEAEVVEINDRQAIVRYQEELFTFKIDGGS